MKKEDIKVFLFEGVIAKLNNITVSEGDTYSLDGIAAILAWENRDDFIHNYERHKFLAKRPKYIIIGTDATRHNTFSVMVKEERHRKITIYRNNIMSVFNTNGDIIINALKKMLCDYYDDITVKDSCDVTRVDMSNGRYSSNITLRAL